MFVVEIHLESLCELDSGMSERIREWEVGSRKSCRDGKQTELKNPEYFLYKQEEEEVGG